MSSQGSDGAQRAAEEILKIITPPGLDVCEPIRAFCCVNFDDCVLKKDSIAAFVDTLIAEKDKRIAELEGESGVGLIAKERRRQIDEKRFDAAHDDANAGAELAWAACYYAMPGAKLTPTGHAIHPSHLYPCPPWSTRWAKGNSKTRIEQLTVAGALIAAEIDRLKRKEAAFGS